MPAGPRRRRGRDPRPRDHPAHGGPQGDRRAAPGHTRSEGLERPRPLSHRGASVGPFRYGQTVIVKDMLDPMGRNAKDRPALIVTPDDEIIAGGPLSVVGISTLVLGKPLPD